MAIKYIDVVDTSNPTSITARQATATITGITAASPAVVTAANDFAASDVVSFASVAGMTEINGKVATIASANATTFTTDIDSTLFTAYTSGGVATKTISSPTVTEVRLVYNDAIPRTMLVDATQKAKEALVALG